MAEDMLKRVARAIATANTVNPDALDYYGAPVWHGWRPSARAAILEALDCLREPSAALKCAAGDLGEGYELTGFQVLLLWQAMIDTAKRELEEINNDLAQR